MYDVTYTFQSKEKTIEKTMHFDSYKDAFEMFSELVKMLEPYSEGIWQDVSFYEMEPRVHMLMHVSDLDYNA